MTCLKINHETEMCLCIAKISKFRSLKVLTYDKFSKNIQSVQQDAR